VITDVSSTDVDIAEIRRQQEAYAAAAQITKIQQALTFLGFYSGPINGLDTPEFRAALAAFQTSVGLPPTGSSTRRRTQHCAPRSARTPICSARRPPTSNA
jgi:peptidoglycan hydrolase-like protein with peptidoglycan-binding domain